MTVRRYAIRLSPDQDALLKHIYLEFGIPSDQYPQRPDDLERFVRRWNDLSEREDTSSDVLHYIFTKRKNKKWVRFDGTHSVAPVQQLDLTVEEWEALDEIYEDLQVGSDNLALHPEVCNKFRQEFAAKTGRVVPGTLLAAVMIRRRKAGGLATLRPETTTSDMGFEDIDEVAG